LLGKALITVITAGLDTQGTRRVILFSVAVVQGFIAGLQPHLTTLRVLGSWHFQLGQRLHVIVGQFPGFAAVMIGLRTQIAVEHPVRADGRVDQQGLEAVLTGQPCRIVAAERAAYQQWATQLTDCGLQLGDGLTRMMMQGRHAQLIAKAHALHHRYQLRGLLGLGSAVEPVDIQDGTRHAMTPEDPLS